VGSVDNFLFVIVWGVGLFVMGYCVASFGNLLWVILLGVVLICYG